MISAGHFRTLLAMHSGVDLDLLEESMGAADLSSVLDYAEAPDLAIIIIPLFTFVLLILRGKTLPRRFLDVGLAYSAIALVLYLPEGISRATGHKPAEIQAPIRMTPATFLAASAWERLSAGPNPLIQRAKELEPLEHQGIYPASTPPPSHRPASQPIARPTTPKAEEATAWNVLVIIMESTGREYVFDRSRGNETPMPTLKRLASEGLFLANHHSTSNSSARSIFSIFTGLYPRPTSNMFCTRPDLVMPGMASHLGKEYERFLVTPGRLQSYFPLALLQHEGFEEIYAFDNLPLEELRPHRGGGRNELDGADAFLTRLDRAQEPFLATYYSYAPHYHYYDHGPEYRIFDDLEEPIHRYYNGMRLLDTQIERMIDSLKKSGRLERTVLLIVGDHGEAFGQHEGNWTHSRQSYMENFAAPALLYQPALFSPQTVDTPTSHVDLLPTLLDALDREYDPTSFQGWSLLRGEPQRDYIYLFGNEGTLASIATDTRPLKLELAFPKASCRTFDLERDAREMSPLDCAPQHTKQRDDLLRYWNFQRVALEEHNRRFAASP